MAINMRNMLIGAFVIAHMSIAAAEPPASSQGESTEATRQAELQRQAIQLLRQARSEFSQCDKLFADGEAVGTLVLRTCAAPEPSAKTAKGDECLLVTARKILSKAAFKPCGEVVATVFFRPSPGHGRRVLIDDTRRVNLAGLGLKSCPSELESEPRRDGPCPQPIFGPGSVKSLPAKK